MTTSLVEFATEYSGAWASHEADAITAMHTDDSVFELHGVGASATGRVAIRDLIATLLKTVPDLRFKPLRVHFGADHFVTEYVMSGTTQGKQFAIAGADLFTMRGGLVGRKDTYLDWLAYQRQVGVDPLATFKELQR
jgi:ketosteroid isomerase-like protein